MGVNKIASEKAFEKTWKELQDSPFYDEKSWYATCEDCFMAGIEYERNRLLKAAKARTHNERRGDVKLQRVKEGGEDERK